MRLSESLIVPCALALAVPLTSAGCMVHVDKDDYVVREEKRFEVKGRPELRLATFDGSIEVRAWDRSEVRVEIEKRGGNKEMAESIRVEAEQEGDRVRVEARGPDTDDWVFGLAGVGHLSRSARLVATVPHECHLVVVSGDGSLQVERVAGRLELRTGDGSVRGLDLDGDVTVDTGDGWIKLEGLSGRLDARTGDGSVAAQGRLEAVRLFSDDGSITLRAAPGSRMTDDWDVRSGDGGVVVYLPEGFGAKIDAETEDGSIRPDAVFALEAASDERASRLHADLAGGGRVLRIRTSDGTIGLRRY